MSDGALQPRVVMPRGPRRDDVLQVDIVELGDRGVGVGVLCWAVGPGGQPRDYRVLARHAVPGDRVELQVAKCRRSEVTGRVVRWLERSADRVEPPCTHAASPDRPAPRCGGCPIQALSVEAQAANKRGWIEGLLERARLEAGVVQPPTVLERPFFHRNKMEFSFARAADGGAALGLRPAGYRYEVVDLTACHIFAPDTGAVLAAVRDAARVLALPPFDGRDNSGWLRTLTVRDAHAAGERLVELTTSGDDPVETCDGPRAAAELADELLRAFEQASEVPVVSSWWTQHIARRGERTRFESTCVRGREHLNAALSIEGIGELTFAVHPRAFFQPSTRGAELLYAEVVRAAGDVRGRRVLDLYCGTGTLGLCFARAGAQVLGVELVEDAVDNARANAAANGIEGARFVAGDAAESLAALDGSDRAFDVVVVDPPRAGLSPAALEQVASLGAPSLIYVSCNPEALARDAALLTKVGYALTRVQPVDQFPHTWHVECVARLERTLSTPG